MPTNEIIERNRKTVEAFLAGTHSANIDDVEIIDETVVPHIVCHGFPGFPNGAFNDRESYKAFFRIFRQSFSDMRFETLKTLVTEDFVSVHWEIGATHSGAFQGIAPDGARVIFDGIALYRMEAGKIAETWLTINEPLLVSQLGKGRARAAGGVFEVGPGGPTASLVRGTDPAPDQRPLGTGSGGDDGSRPSIRIPTLLSVAYRLRIPAEAFRLPAEVAAHQIAQAPGLVWKIWGLDADTGEGTSVYLFRDTAAAAAFAAGPAMAQLRDGPAERVTTRIAPVDVALSTLTGAAGALATTTSTVTP